jgi:hypothetical protein
MRLTDAQLREAARIGLMSAGELTGVIERMVPMFTLRHPHRAALARAAQLLAASDRQQNSGG